MRRQRNETNMNTFTKEQLEAISSDAPKIAVIAGPGSGKTRTLIERIIYLKGIGKAVPHQIACITFTNEAAWEVERRLSVPFGDSAGNIEDVRPFGLGYCGTVHGFILRLLKEHGKLIGLKGKIAVMDEQQQTRFIEQVIADMKIKVPMKLIREQLAKGPEMFMSVFKKDLSDSEIVAHTYFQRMISASLLDFDSILQFGAILIQKMGKEGIGVPFTHIFWDEFQDSGVEDMAILSGLTIPNKFIVGDPDQSIYGFRGGNPKHIIGLVNDPAWHVVKLEDNFRCDAAITKAANSLISRNPGRIDKQTISKTGMEGKVWTFRTDTESLELRGLAEDINAQSDARQCAVLVRSNALADTFAKGLEGFGIKVSRKEKTEKPPGWFQARGLINLFANPDNDLLAFDFLAQSHDKKFASRIKLEALSKFTSINRHYLKIPQDMKISEVPSALAKSGIGPEAIERINVAIAGLPEGATLAELSFALGDEELHRKEVGEGITVTTMHSAKGREWDCVYLPAFEDGCCPLKSKSANIEEERRLAFVAITRAKRRLCVSFSKMRKPQFGGFKPEPTTMSCFIDEIRRGE